MRKADYTLAPLVPALVLGPHTEKSFRQTLVAEKGNIFAFIERPLSASLVGLALLLFVLTLLNFFRKPRRGGVPAE
ncbi:MAG: hypothetical protein QNI90_13560 [Dinoroseobacter sp.]|nr:hypothetical protein [Dinoroseobacter sp.]